LTNPPEKGAEAPDWFYVPNVPPLVDGEVRRSYVLWKEYVTPLIVLEFVSGDGREERDSLRDSFASEGNLLLTGDERSQLLASQLEQER
jgi:hypothetical protein